MLLHLFRFASARQIRNKPLRTALTVVGIALGVALFVAIQAINDSTLEFFRGNVAAFSGNAALAVLGDEVGFSEEVVEAVKQVPGVEAAVPTLETRARVIRPGDPTASRETLVVLGIDFLQESAVRSYNAEGGALGDPLEFLNQADSIVVTASFAVKHHLAMESPLELATAQGTRTFVVRGVLAAEGAASAYGGAVAIMDIDGARLTFGRDGKVDRIDVVPAEGEDEEALARRLENVVTPGLRVERKAAQAEGLARMVRGYQAILSFVSTLALLVGAFLVASTVTLSIAERRREIGILRALGGSRAAVVMMFVVEASVLGLAGGLLGIVLGRVLAELLVGQVSSSMSRQCVVPIEVSQIRFRAIHAVLGLAAGTLSAFLAALRPALRTTAIHPSEALKSEPSEAGDARPRMSTATLVGFVMLAALLVASELGLTKRAPALEMLVPILCGLGSVLVAPFLVMAPCRWLTRWRGLARTPVLRLACENLLRNGARTGGSTLSLVAGLMLVIVVGTVHRSFEGTIGDWQDRAFKTDVIVSSSGRLVGLDVQPLDESIAEDIDRAPGIDRAGGRGARAVRVARASLEGRPIAIKAMDRPHPRTGFSVLDVQDGSAEDAGRAMFEEREVPNVLVSANFAAQFGKAKDDLIELDAPTGRKTFRIAAIVVDFGHPNGVVILARDVYKRVWNDTLVTAFAVEADSSTTPARLRAAIDAEIGPRGLVAMLPHELRKQLDDVLTESLAYTRAIEGAALLVGLMGLLGTLLMSLLERMRELGMLRAIGMSRPQLARMIVAEAMLLGVVGGLVAAGLGAYVARLWIVGGLTRSLGWFITVRVPLGAVVTTVGAGLLVGIVAGFLGSRRVVRISIREALVVSS